MVDGLSAGASSAKPASTLQALRAKIRRIEGHGADFGQEVVSLDQGRLDHALPWHGLPKRTLHELSGRSAASLAAAFMSRVLQAESDKAAGAVLWCMEDRRVRAWGEIYGPGLQRFGIAPENFLLARARNPKESLWVTEAALRSSAVLCVVAELPPLDLLTSRRLQLAAEEGGGLGLALLSEQGGGGVPDLAPNAAVTRWRAEPASGLADLSWQLDLWRCRGGTPGRWEVRWDEPTLSFSLVAETGARAVEPRCSPCRAAHCT